MFARLIVPAVAAAFVFSTAAFAAGTQHKDENRVQTLATKAAQRCTTLENQFDAVINSHGGAAKADSARLLRTQAGALCGQGDHEQGTIKLEEALKDLGVTPKA